MNKHILVSLIAFLGLSAQAATTCPDLNGKWVGSCQVNSSNYRMYDSLQPLLKPMQADELVIEQLPSDKPMHCNALKVGGQNVVIDGLQTESTFVPVETVGTIGFAASKGSSWKGDALVGKHAGLVQFPGAGHIAFAVNDTLTKKDKDTMERSGYATGDGFEISISCIYKRL